MLRTETCCENPCFLCRHCLAQWKETILEERRVLHFKKGQPIIREGEKAEGLYYTTAGAVKVHQSWGAGKEFILRFAGAGDVVGYRAQGAADCSPISVTTLEATTVCFITNEFVEHIYRADPSFLYTMMRLYATELRAAENRMRDLAIMPVKGRVAASLFTIREVFGMDDRGYTLVPVTRLDIACHAGTTYEAVFRLLSEWVGKGFVTTEGKKIQISDDAALRKAATQ